MTYVTGQSRFQASLFPQSLDELVSSNHAVRVIDAFVDGLDLAELGFSRPIAETGRPPYAPGDLLKLYVYGYTNQMRSSRRLEREGQRNVEVMWLINRVSPSFKTIADFRKDHASAIVGVCRAFIRFCRQQALFGGTVLAIDGTKIGAVASRKKVITQQELAKMMAAIDHKIAEYLAAMDEADKQEPREDVVTTDVAGAIRALQERRAELQVQAGMLAQDGLSQRVVGEEEARLMRTANHGHQVAYNGQIAVDSQHHLIAAFELTNSNNDLQQLHPMAVQGKEALGVDSITVVADGGYSNGEHGALCESGGITAIVPRPPTTNNQGRAFFPRSAFTYDEASDSWRCPAGEMLGWRGYNRTNEENLYWTEACAGCALKAQCTKSRYRRVTRHRYEEARETMNRRATSDPQWMKIRRETAEHPFGTLKWLMGHPRFLVRGIKKAKSELALTVLAYNLKRVISLLGVQDLLNRLRPVPA